jgi:hypothetical protein
MIGQADDERSVRDTGEHQFFADPAMDVLARVVMDLAAEVYVQRDRLRALEDLLQQSKALAPGNLDAYTPDSERFQQLMKERDAFVAQLFAPILKADQRDADASHSTTEG